MLADSFCTLGVQEGHPLLKIPEVLFLRLNKSKLVEYLSHVGCLRNPSWVKYSSWHLIHNANTRCSSEYMLSQMNEGELFSWLFFLVTLFHSVQCDLC